MLSVYSHTVIEDPFVDDDDEDDEDDDDEDEDDEETYEETHVPHMECYGNSFQDALPATPPLILVSCTLLLEHHAKYDRTMKRKKRNMNAVVYGLADTGAMICTAGPELLTYFAVDEDFLVPTDIEVQGVTHSSLTMLGVLFLELSSNGICTKQMIYIAKEAGSLILSETTLKNLGVIPSNFPTAGTFNVMSVRVRRKVSPVKPKLRKRQFQNIRRQNVRTFPRTRRAPERLSPTMHGKYHETKTKYHNIRGDPLCLRVL
jgi:hypothetical protein